MILTYSVVGYYYSTHIVALLVDGRRIIWGHEDHGPHHILTDYLTLSHSVGSRLYPPNKIIPSKIFDIPAVLNLPLRQPPIIAEKPTPKSAGHTHGFLRFQSLNFDKLNCANFDGRDCLLAVFVGVNISLKKQGWP